MTTTEAAWGGHTFGSVGVGRYVCLRCLYTYKLILYCYVHRIPVGINRLLNFTQKSSTSGRRGVHRDKASSRRPCPTWTHKFVCLAQTDFDHVPSPNEKFMLKCAGLGEKKVTLSLDGGWAYILLKKHF